MSGFEYVSNTSFVAYNGAGSEHTTGAEKVWAPRGHSKQKAMKKAEGNSGEDSDAFVIRL